MCGAAEHRRERRRLLDHERYMRERDVRKARQRAYYAEHREEILQKARLRSIDAPPRKAAVKKDVRASKREWYYRNRKAKNPRVFANQC